MFKTPKNMRTEGLQGLDIPRDLEVYWDRRLFENRPKDNN